MSECYVNSTQLLTAAKILAAASPAVCNGRAEERPGYLSQDADSGVLVLTIGILSTDTYRINRRGKVEAET